MNSVKVKLNIFRISLCPDFNDLPIIGSTWGTDCFHPSATGVLADIPPTFVPCLREYMQGLWRIRAYQYSSYAQIAPLFACAWEFTPQSSTFSRSMKGGHLINIARRL